MGLTAFLLSPILAVAVASRLVNFRRSWPPRLAVLIAGLLPMLFAVVFTQGLAFSLSPLIFFYLIVGDFTYAVLSPR